MFILYGNIIERVTALFFLVENLLPERFDFAVSWCLEVLVYVGHPGGWQATLTRYEVNINHSQGKVLPSVRVSDPGLLLKPDEPNLIIMAKPVGGPNKKDQHAGMDED
ncbi:uncharacterized protein LOC109949750 [Prunus persica]|uniref:uncharacterized protein LOC109949750 n=1 Tax=Prunus persica TaxID=3760 RepID=UPI0009AB41BE|nr:uncharacterized protein LOC109949750 [Prunus persica]